MDFRTKEWHDEFSRFTFLHISQTWSWRSQQPRNINESRPKKKKPTKAHSFLAKRPGKEQPRKIEHLDNNCSTSAKQHRKYGDHPIPTSDDRCQLGSLDFYPHKTVMRCPQHHTRAVPGSVREGQVPSQDFHLCQLVTSPPIHTQNSVSGEYRRNLGFLSLPAIMRYPYPSPLG